MTTVGYGDYYPITNYGRIIMFVCCLWGTVVMSLMIITVNNNLSFDQSEKRSFILLQRILFKEDMFALASDIISSAFKIMWGYKRQGRKFYESKESRRLISLYIKNKTTLRKRKVDLYSMNIDTSSDPDGTKRELRDIKIELLNIQQQFNNDVKDLRILSQELGQLLKGLEEKHEKIEKHESYNTITPAPSVKSIPLNQ